MDNDNTQAEVCSNGPLGALVRQEFEQWMTLEGGNLARNASRPDQYANAAVQGRWRTWQACEAITRQRIHKAAGILSADAASNLLKSLGKRGRA